MSARILQRLLITLLPVIAMAGWLGARFGPKGHGGYLRRIYPSMALGLVGVTLLCLGAVWSQRQALLLVHDEAERETLERQLAAQVAWIYLALALSVPLGYWIGRRFA